MKQFEVNFDGLVGPTHNYAGLSFGNVASLNNANAKSSPKQAAKQGLAKAKALAEPCFALYIGYSLFFNIYLQSEWKTRSSSYLFFPLL